MKNLKSIFLTLIGLCLFANSLAAQNTAGTLDTTFGTGGKLVSPIGQNSDIANGIAVQPDDKIVVVGTAFTPTKAFVVVRFNSNGTLDTTFDGDGIVSVLFGSINSGDSYAVAIQPDGKIVAAGRATLANGTPAQAVLLRLNPNGSLDTTFDTDGKVTTAFEIGANQFRALKIQTDGKIVAAGDSFLTANNSKLAVARYNADGSLDTTFDADGKQTLEMGLGQDTAFGVEVQTDGKIVAAGRRSLTTAFFNEDFAIVRFNTDGSLDTGFDTDGIQAFSFETGFWDRCNSVALQPDGKIVAAGFTSNGTLISFGLVRLNPNGSFDTSFDGDGLVTTNIGVGGVASAVALQADGKIIAGGTATDGTNSDFGVARYNPNGSLDATFGNNGTVNTPIGAFVEQAYAMAIQPDGKIVLAGETQNSSESSDFALVRYNNNGVKDAIMDFNGDGKTDWAVQRRPGQVGPWTWFIRYNGSDNFIAQQFGQSPLDLFQPMDYDGDGKDDIAVYRRGTGYFYILNSSNNSIRFAFVGAGDSSSHGVAADYDGDGKDDPAAFLAPSAAQGVGQANWCYVASLNNPQQTVTCIPFGQRYGTQSDQVDEPYPGDFDGDGRADIRVQRRTDISNGGNPPAVFITQLGATSAVSYDYFGLNGDRILPGDYDGDGKTDICVARGFNIGTNPPTPIQFFIRYSSGQPDETINFGVGSNFNFAQGDYDGDGKDDLAFTVSGLDAANPQQSYFWVRPSANPNQSIIYPWGRLGDLPVAGYNNR